MPLIVPMFLTNRGCPHRCLFCNQRLTAGDQPETITQTTLDETVRLHLGSAGRRKGPVQIAFYGGTFTGMALDEQRRLLELAGPYLKRRTVDGIRIATRPDEIDPEGLDLLEAFGVTTVELGVQSLDDEVLLRSRRGHTAEDVIRALKLLKARGFETGIHLMAGLPGDDRGRFAGTVEKAIRLGPDMVRIHPTVVLKDTLLAEAFYRGSYRPLTLAEAVEWCKAALRRLTAAGIPVIRLGLQTTGELEAPGAVVAGPFHPAFRSLVEAALFGEMAASLLMAAGWNSGSRTSGTPIVTPQGKTRFLVSPADISNFYGPRRKNIASLRCRFVLADIAIAAAPLLPRGNLILVAGDQTLKADFSGRIAELTGEGLHPNGGRGMDE
jgi:histone acetyltransferase (RNA polymerase elongator complex component)